MLRSAVAKVMWVGRATVFMVGLAVIVGLVFGVASMAFAGNGDPWRLGQNNVATAITVLGGAAGVDGPMVRLTNNNADADDTALDLKVQAGEAPLTVNSDAQVANLNADKLDGLDSSAFYRVSSKVKDSDYLDGKDSTEFLGKTEKAADSDRLDGLDYTEIGVNGLEVVEAWSANNSDSHKTATAYCPWRKILIGTGFSIAGYSSPTDLEVSGVTFDEDDPDYLTVRAYEEEPTSANWSVKALAICARAGY